MRPVPLITRLPLRLALFSLLASALMAAHAEPELSITLEASAGGAQDALLRWPTRSGWQYMVEGSPDLIRWDDLQADRLAGSGLALQRAFPLGSVPAFFRISTDPHQLYNLALPDDGTRYDSYAEFDGPRWPANYGEGHVTLWYKGKFAAYSITIDDNNKPDFPFWLEVSETYGWKLTWFVIVHPYVWDIYNNVTGSNTGYSGTLADWKVLHDLGQDIQLHGSCGPMNDLTAAQYEDHIVRSIDVMEGATGGRILTFAYPCGNIFSEDGQHDYLEIITRHMISARGGVGGGVTAVHLTNYLTTRSLGVNALTNGEPGSLFTRYDDMRSFLFSAYRGWCVTLYHGVQDSDEAGILATLDWVKAHEDEFWVGSYTDVAKYAQERESSTLSITLATPSRIEFSVTDRMDDSIYDHPLTVKLRVDAAWTGIRATQAGAPVLAYLFPYAGGVYAYVEPVPDRGLVVVERVD